MKNEITIAITGLNATDNPGPGVPVIRSLKEANSFDCRIIGLSYELLEPGIYMCDLVDKCYQIPYPGNGTDTLLNRLKYINSKEHIDVIIPNYDAELFSFIKIEADLQQMGIKTVLPTAKQLEERQKYNLPKLCQKYGINIPVTHIYNTYKELKNGNILPPAMIKGKYYEAHLCKTTDETINQGMEMVAKWGYPIICQEVLSGTEFNVTGCGDGKGNTIAAVAMRKQFITDKGKAWAGITIENPAMLKLCQQFVTATKWKGGFELELMQTKDKKIYLIEINPRMPAWIYLATGAGQNIPEQIVLLAIGKEPDIYHQYKIGKMFIRYSWDLLIDQNEMADFTIKRER